MDFVVFSLQMNTIAYLWSALLVVYLFACFAISRMTGYTSSLISVDRDPDSHDEWTQFLFKVKRWKNIVILSHVLVAVLLVIIAFLFYRL